MVRARTKVLVSFGDCAVTGNVTAMRNPLGGAEIVLRRSYLENGDLDAADPPERGSRARAPGPGDPGPRRRAGRCLHPGLPAAGARIREVLEQLVSQHAARLTGADLKFG